MEKLLFHEEQRHKQWWLWLMLCFTLLAIIIPIAISVQEEWLPGISFSGQPDSVTESIVAGGISIIVMAVVFSFIFIIQLKTKITDKGIYVAYSPIYRKWKFVARNDIERYETRTYRAKREFGGYGVRKRRKNGQAYIVSGNTGLQLYLSNGKKLLIGTQKKQAIEYAMRKLLEEEG